MRHGHGTRLSARAWQLFVFHQRLTLVAASKVPLNKSVYLDSFKQSELDIFQVLKVTFQA